MPDNETIVYEVPWGYPHALAAARVHRTANFLIVDGPVEGFEFAQSFYVKQRLPLGRAQYAYSPQAAALAKCKEVADYREGGLDSLKERLKYTDWMFDVMAGHIAKYMMPEEVTKVLADTLTKAREKEAKLLAYLMARLPKSEQGGSDAKSE